MLQLLLVLALSQNGDAGARRTAIVGVDGCEAPLARSRVTQLREQLAPRMGGALLSEADTAARLGGLPGRSLPELRRALDGARDAFYSGRAQKAVQDKDVGRQLPQDGLHEGSVCARAVRQGKLRHPPGRLAV